MVKNNEENNELDVDLAKFLKDDQEALERQLNNYRLKQIYRDAVENMKRTSAQISAILKGEQTLIYLENWKINQKVQQLINKLPELNLFQFRKLKIVKLHYHSHIKHFLGSYKKID